MLCTLRPVQRCGQSFREVILGTRVCVCVCVCLIACDLSTSKKKEAAYGPVGEFGNKKNNLLWKVGLLSAETLKIDICSIINASSMT